MRSRQRPRVQQKGYKTLLAALTHIVCAGLPRALRADVAPDLPPDLETILPEPVYVVGIGLAISVVIVLLGTRVVASGKLSRRVLNVVLFLIGAATAITAVYAKKVRVDYANEVQRVRDSYKGPPQRFDLEDSKLSDEPPTIHPPGLDPPGLDPPGLDPPGLDPPSVDPPSVDPPSVDPPSVDPPSVDPPSVDPPSVDPPSVGDAIPESN